MSSENEAASSQSQTKILLEEDDGNMFGEEEEEEDVDMDDAPPAVAVKVKEEVPSAQIRSESHLSQDELKSAKVEDVDKDMFGDDGDDDHDDHDDNDQDETKVGKEKDVKDAATTSAPTTSPEDNALLSTLPATSPFPHHNAGPTADRLRNAMHRIAADPMRDAEAWQALLTEAQSSYRTLLPSLSRIRNASMASMIEPSGPEAELLGRRLDWIEGCYGALLHHFPYAVSHYAQLVEMLMRLSSLTQDEEEQCGAGGVMSVGGLALSNSTLSTTDQGVAITPASILMSETMATSGTERQRRYEAKLDRIFQICLGVTMDGSPALHGDIHMSQLLDVEAATSLEGARTIMGGLFQSSIDLWLLYIRKRSRDAARTAAVEIPIPPPPPGYVPNAAVQASVIHSQYEESLRASYRDRKELVRDRTTQAYETALKHGAGFAQNNHLLWKRYVNFVKSWTDPVDYSSAAAAMTTSTSTIPSMPPPLLPPADPAHDHTTSQKQLSQLRSIFQRGVTHPMTGLDQFWLEYETFERSHSETLGNVLIAEWLPKYQHARSVYLERNRMWTMHELRGGRLAVPPVGCETGNMGIGSGTTGSGSNAVGITSTSSSGVGAMMGLTSRGGSASASVVGADDDFAGETSGSAAAAAASKAGKSENDSEYLARLEEERMALSKWRRRSGYERTNPERLTSSEHTSRVRASYSEEVCAFARHPEVWFEWSQWELLHGNSVVASSSSSFSSPPGGATSTPPNVASNVSSAALITPAKAGDLKSGGNAIRAVAVLTLGMESLPDSALLAQAQAEILERYVGFLGGKDDKNKTRGCIKVMESFVSRSPTTLGFVLLQRLARRHEGIAAARAVFSRARRTLRIRDEDLSFNSSDGNDLSSSTSSKKEGIEDINGDRPSEEFQSTSDAGRSMILPQQRMVTNRLKPSVGFSKNPTKLPLADDAKDTKVTSTPAATAGFITWHLYAAHATIEHRLGKKPQVAARIYELGLRKHRTFLSTPPYVLHYAGLLLELNDEENLRSLLMRAVAACEEEEAIINATAGVLDPVAIARRREVQRPLWDMMLKFESILSSRSGNGNVSADIRSIESRRRRALYGPGNEDVVMGGEGPPDEEEDRNLGAGVQKSSLNEQLVRVEGYDVASRIANGMARMVDVLTVTGAMGNGEFDTSSLDFVSAASTSLAAGGVSYDIWGDECAGGPSDISYVRRLRFQRESRTRASTSALLGGLPGANQGTSGGTGKLLSSRERSTGVGQGVNAIALQSSPEWLRPLLLLLPPIPKFGRGLNKPPPHLIEMALSALRANELPSLPADSTRTNGSAGSTAAKKRGREDNDGDSSDEEHGGKNGTFGGGYSNQFRSRQRSRLYTAASLNGGNTAS